jgi:glutamate synthase (NADPH) small chain
MGKPTGFKEYSRELPASRPIEQRTLDYREIYLPFAEDRLRNQAARCMDCGVPFCHSGCPLGNLIPDWNDLVYRNRWRDAVDRLHATNNFPEFTGRICPAPCEEACVLSINEPAVTIELIEKEIIERAFEEGWVRPQPPDQRTGKTVAVVGSGPAGLACAQQLNRAGHTVTVFERADRIGGLLRYGIPDFKMEKGVLDRRLKILEQEGIVFRASMDVGKDVSAEDLKTFNAVVLCGGATKPRDLPIPGRELGGIHFAMDFLTQQNRRGAGETIDGARAISATGKRVIIIGGGDTGSDCVGTALRQGAKSVTSFELLPQPLEDRPPHQPWPYWPMRLRMSSSHREGGSRYWSISTKRFVGAQGRLRSLITVNVEFVPTADGRPAMREVPGTEHEWPVELALLALGFSGPELDGVIARLGLDLDRFGNVKTDPNYMTSVPGVFAAGDMRRGQSLVVWAVSEGREAARGADQYLMGSSCLPTKGNMDLPRV